MRTAILCALLAGTPQLGAGEAKLVDALKRVERTLSSQRYAAARDEVLAALGQHEGQGYVLYHWNVIASVLERAAFGARFPRPDPTKLVSGEVLAYSPGQGSIDLCYSLERGGRPPSRDAAKPGPDLSDFKKSGAILVHPLVFDGPYTIEIEGDGYPAHAPNAQPPVIACGSEFGASYFVAFGLRPELAPGEKPKEWVRAAIAHVEQGRRAETVAEADPSIAPGESYALKVVVDATSIQAYAQGDLVLSVKKPDDLYGQFGLVGFEHVRKVRVRGRVQPSWLEGIADAAVQKQRAGFEAAYDATAEAPEWLRARLAQRSDALPEFEDHFPGRDHPARRATLVRARAFVDAQDARGGLEYVRALPDTGTTPALRAWMEASIRAAADDHEGALAAARRVLAIDARFTPARALAVQCLVTLERRSAAIEECRAWLAAEPERPEPYVQLASLCLYDDRAAEARATLRAAIDAGIPPGDLATVDRVLARAEQGPPWLTSHVYRSAHYEVRSDIGPRVCYLAATELEKFYAKYSACLRRAPRGERRLFRVYVFAGQAGYLAYTQDLLGEKPEHTAGLYSPALKQLLIWNVPTIDELLRTVRHEGFHQFLDRFSSAAPRWLDEGLAQYYESAKLVAGSWQDGAILPEHAARLAKSPLVPLREFLHQDESRFYAPARRDLHYAQAWALVHFLQHSSDAHRRTFERFLDLIVTGTKPGDALARVFDERTTAEIDRALAGYVLALRSKP